MVKKHIPENVSVEPIKLMRLVLKKKRLPVSEHFTLENKIKSFENTTL